MLISNCLKYKICKLHLLNTVLYLIVLLIVYLPSRVIKGIRIKILNEIVLDN